MGCRILCFTGPDTGPDTPEMEYVIFAADCNSKLDQLVGAEHGNYRA